MLLQCVGNLLFGKFASLHGMTPLFEIKSMPEFLFLSGTIYWGRVRVITDALTSQQGFTLATKKHVFTNPRTGCRWSGDLVVRAPWARALKSAGIRYRRPYQTRHTYASMMLTAGESPMWVAQQMGHKDWTMIARVYGRWIKNAIPHAGDKAVSLFTRANPRDSYSFFSDS